MMTILPTTLLPTAADPPLDPSGDDARSSLRRELAKPEYHETDLLQRAIDWIGRFFDDAVNSAGSSPPLVTFLGALVLIGIGVGVGLLIGRARRSARARDEKDGRCAALTDEDISAAELRERAERALAEGRFAMAVVDGFRALAVRQIERGRIDDIPQATAHELARALGEALPSSRERIDASADVFDEVLYGERPASREQAVEMLALDDALAGRRVRR